MASAEDSCGASAEELAAEEEEAAAMMEADSSSVDYEQQFAWTERQFSQRRRGEGKGRVHQRVKRFLTRSRKRHPSQPPSPLPSPSAFKCSKSLCFSHLL